MTIDAHDSMDSHSNEQRMPVLTKIIATLGPASSEPATVRRLIEAGVSIFRLNFSHGNEDDQLQRLNSIRSLAVELGRPVAVLGDLPGPKIRIAQSAGAGATVEQGATVILHMQAPDAALDAGGVYHFTPTEPGVLRDIELGNRVLIADGAVRMLVVEKNTDSIACTVLQGGLIAAGKGINLPDSNLSLAILTERDRHYVKWAVQHEVDFLALSFVRGADDLIALRDLVHREAMQHQLTWRMPLIAKIELPSALKHIDSIVEEADGIMVARGDLGVEMDLAEVPVIQKELIAKARLHAKPCIVATQMLESMIDAQTPTRAEVSDVAGAIFDGADAIMLSGETAVGRYPVLAVEHMHRIAARTERHIAQQPSMLTAPSKPMDARYRTAILAHGVWTIARDMHSKFIVVWSQQGGGARHLSQFDFCIPILAVSTDDRALRQMQLLRAVTPIRMNEPDDLDHFTQMVDLVLLDTGWAKAGDQCVLVAGEPIGTHGVTNRLAIHEIGNHATGFHHLAKPDN